MTRFFLCHFCLLLVCLGYIAGVSPALAEEQYKVLVVFSYEENAPWDIEIREEIEKVLSPFAELSFFYMDTKAVLAGGPQKGAEAFALYQKLQPDGVIAVDDNAQSMFVVPYLKNKVTIPIMFCGVNGAPELYGYPTPNISGILERFHLEESISLTRQLAGDIETFAFMVKESPVSALIADQLEEDKHRLSARMVKFLTPSTMEEALEMAEDVRDEADLLFLVALWGMADSGGKKLREEDSIPQLVKAFGKPTTAIGGSVVKQGALCAVITNGREHGHRAADMLLQAMRGVSMKQLPVTRNSRGKRMINVTTMKRLGAIPDPLVLRGAKLVRSD
ncbi:MAG: ABC transporter substrate binding protein [Thermodesulfobacteriota bacterium]|nr:ABC transporter substrate binding protein [Thermodesulfobacteriota bacterium]